MGGGEWMHCYGIVAGLFVCRVHTRMRWMIRCNILRETLTIRFHLVYSTLFVTLTHSFHSVSLCMNAQLHHLETDSISIEELEKYLQRSGHKLNLPFLMNPDEDLALSTRRSVDDDVDDNVASAMV
uniref:Uncharacterized protein n=1 Tax=Craspedostauros australis TaxID=1486917 RepID=A0A7R9ZL23_9STRA|mmetsp:Transcript_19441/g.54070  ORF Transcript_19441/g.54070 Transcript_19441/m.54070 type:complete len:126 (+) Transcript_19441:3-380(+)